MSRGISWILLSRLAFNDLRFDKKISFCIIAALIAVIAPLLLLFSLKYGVISQLQRQLIEDPRNLEIKIIGNHHLQKDWFDWVQEQPETRFVIPLTRSLSSLVDLRSDKTHFVRDVELIPSAKGDPLLEQPAFIANPNGIILSAIAAEKLEAHIGDTITLIVSRSINGKNENGLTPFLVEGILPETRFNRAAAFVTLDVLIDTEKYRDGYPSSLFPNAEAPLTPNSDTKSTFAKARLYANTLDDVAPLASKLRKQHIETQTEAQAIENVKAINFVLTIIFSIIAGVSLLGCVLSLGGSFWANIDRKKKDIALLRLLGLQSSDIIHYLILQAIFLSGTAFIISSSLFSLGSFLFNKLLGRYLSKDIFVSTLPLSYMLIALVFTLVVSSIVAILGGFRAVKIQPAESLREI